MVVDGPIPNELEDTLNTIKKEYDVLKLVRFEKNRGHAAARQAGVDNATNELVAVMDSDDIALPDRFEKQLSFLQANPDIDIVGGQIDEFIGEVNNVVGKREVPCTDKDIQIYMKSRCPMNLVTVLARKNSIQRVGGYIDWFCEEDYYLWIRMALAGCKFANLPDTLVNVRVGKTMYQRRGGWKYFKSEAKLQHYMWKNGVIGNGRYLYNVAIRFAVQVAIPNSVRGWVFRTFARS
jgi:glycosyltransferase involved in cell wall biosynthesis